MTKRTLVLIVGGGLLATGVGIAAIKEKRSTRRTDAAARVQAGPLDVVAPGRVEGKIPLVELGFERGGRLAEILVEEGARVEQDQVLARLDSDLEHARLARAKAALTGARAQRDAKYRGALPEELKEAEAQVEAAQERARNAASARARGEQLHSMGSMGAAEAEKLGHAAEAAAAQARAAEARLAAVQRGTRNEIKRASLAEVAAAKARVDEAEVLLSQTELRAPFAGVVIREHREVGELLALTPPTVVISISDLSRLRLRAEIDEEDIGSLEIGQRGTATADAYPGRKFAGEVVAMMQDIGNKELLNEDPRARVDTRVLEVLFEFDDTPTLPLGLRMTLRLPGRQP
jgi:multidrug resistance efflux pump